MGITKTFYLIIACLSLMAGAAQAETLDKIVAVVNGDIILYSELEANVRLLEKISPEIKTTDPGKQAQVQREVLQQMVRERLAEQEVQRMKITVTPREIDETIERIKVENHLSNAQFEEGIKQDGQTVEQFRENIKKQLERSKLIDRMLKSKTVITDREVDAALTSGQAVAEVSSGRERHRLAIIFLPLPPGGQPKQVEEVERLAREIHGKLTGGADFARLAQQHSKGPAVEEGGDIGYIEVDELAAPLGAAIRGMPKNALTGPVKTPTGIYIVKVLDLEKERLAQGTTTDREKLRRQLYQKEVNRKFEEWIRELEGKAFIQISL